MTTLDQALDRLVHKRSYRRAFFQGCLDTREFAEADRVALASIDRAMLTSLAEKIAGDVLVRQHSGSGSLLELYPRTIHAWKRVHPEEKTELELAFSFLDSSAFDHYRALPFCGAGSALEEAFFRFAELEGLADPVVREQEFLAAMIKLLLVSPRANVILPDCIRHTPSGFYAISNGDMPTLYAAVRGRYVTGSLTPFLVDLLRSAAPAAATAACHGVSTAVLGQALETLSSLGLLCRLDY